MKKPSITVFLLTMMNLATILSIKNWPFAAEFGFSSLFFILLAVITFFIPSALVSAELATGWPQKGGIFVWVKEALGERMGFLAVWLLWVENVVWYPTILSFIAGTMAYAIEPSLADNNLFTFFTILIIFWGVTLLNFKGIRFSGFISTLGVITGTLLPGALIILLGLSWLYGGKPMEIEMSWNSFIPSITHPYQLVFLSGVILSFAGIEMNAVHANDVENPQRSYPLAILISVILIVIFTSLGTLAIAMVIPQEKINLVAGSVAAIDYFLTAYNLKGYIPMISVLISFGALAGLSTWIAGPSKGLLTAAENGDLPPILRKVNQNGTPVGMLVLQGIIVTILAMVFLIMPNVNSSFWMMTAMVSQLYLLMYLLLFISAIVLKIKRPDVKRAFLVPGNNWGMYLVSSMGILSSLFCIVFGFFPPTQIDTGGVLQYELIQVIGIITFSLAPFVILWFRKPSWKNNV
jgi:putative glutamate/gamma-aminobutyrate antiporter